MGLAVFFPESEKNAAFPACWVLTFQDIVCCLYAPQGWGAVDVVYNGVSF